MTKILLVEDDKSLREIYGVRLFAEGYDVVSAGDGEQALAVAIKERPALIITDVMMPKISGFDMLDILRSTTETKDIKVIVMTALGSEDNRERGERLGADKYLVKSQVGIEDVIREVHNLLGDQAMKPAAPAPMPMQPQPAAPAMQTPPMPAQELPPQPPTPAPISTAPAPPAPRQGLTDIPGRRSRIIQPINATAPQVDFQALVNKELAKEGAQQPATIAEERQMVAAQLSGFGQPGATLMPQQDTGQHNNVPTQPAPQSAPPTSLPPVAPQQQNTPPTAPPVA